MHLEEMMEKGLHGKGALKLILRGSIEEMGSEKVGVTSVLFATLDTALAEEKIRQLIGTQRENEYYMVYSVPFDTDLSTLEHYPSIAIMREDLV